MFQMKSHLGGAAGGVIHGFGGGFEKHVGGLEVCVQYAKPMEVVHSCRHIQQPQQH